MSGVANASGSGGVDSSAPTHQRLSDQELALAVGSGFWDCAATFVFASALVIGAGLLTAGAGTFLLAVLGAGTFGLTAESMACK